MVSGAPTSALRRLLDEHVTQVSTTVEALLAESRERTRRDLVDELNGAARRMRQATDDEELAATLVDAASAFGPGAAYLRVDGKTARGERIRGVPDENADRFPGLAIPFENAPALAGAAEHREPMTAIATASEISTELLDVAAGAADTRIAIVPVLVRDSARALLFAWGAPPIAALELLCEIAGSVWSGLEPVTVAAPPPQIVQIAFPEPKTPEPKQPRHTWDSLPAEDQAIHLRAQRAARVAVADLRLHEAAAVQAGRTRRDLYSALRERVDEARGGFRESYFVRCPSMVDYLHLELVRTLANGDADLLGKDYPGPLV